MNLTLRVWRQAARSSEGKFVQYEAHAISPEASFLEMMDVVNDGLTLKGEEPNPSLETAGRVADFFELAELMCVDALHREESCGGHFRVEHQTADGEAQRNDDDFRYSAAWEFTGVGKEPKLHKEALEYEEVKLATRSYK